MISDDDDDGDGGRSKKKKWDKGQTREKKNKRKNKKKNKICIYFCSLPAANLAAPLSRAGRTSSGILTTLKSLSTVAQVTSENCFFIIFFSKKEKKKGGGRESVSFFFFCADLSLGRRKARKATTNNNNNNKQTKNSHRHHRVVRPPPHRLRQHHLRPRHAPHGARRVERVRQPQRHPEGRVDLDGDRVDPAELPGVDRDAELGHVAVAGGVPEGRREREGGWGGRRAGENERERKTEAK